MLRTIKWSVLSTKYAGIRSLCNSKSPSTDSCSNKPHSNCWKCNKLLKCVDDKFFCLSCDMIQPPVKCLNYFQYLGLGEPSYDIDLTNLTSLFRNLQNVLHPDRFSNKTETEQNYSAQQASLVNKAYRTLLEPLPRALYLLELFGKPLTETQEEKSDQTFLLEMLDLNESVHECSDLNYVRKVGEDMKKMLNSLQNDFKIAVENKNYESARKIAVKMKYFVTVKTNVDKKLGFN